MKQFILGRIANTEYGTFGAYIFNNIPFAVTLEPPWEDNEPRISCIPAGIYIARLIKSPTYGMVYEITDVPDRDHVLNHWGNLLANTEGCILIAEKYGRLYDKPAVLTSKNSPGEGFNEFMQLAGGDREILVDIRDYWRGK